MVLNDHAKLDESYQSTERTFVLPEANGGSPYEGDGSIVKDGPKQTFFHHSDAAPELHQTCHSRFRSIFSLRVSSTGLT